MSNQELFYKSNDTAISRTLELPKYKVNHVRQVEKELETSMSTT